MWEKGTRVRVIKGYRTDITGTVVIDKEEMHLKGKRDSFLVEFDTPMGGHSGNGTYRGKADSCWWFDYCPDRVTATDGIKIEQIKRKNNYY